MAGLERIGRTIGPPPLRAPFDAYSPEALLEHFAARPHVRFFAVVDEGETRREKIDAVLDNRFELNHETHRLPAPIDWTTNPSTDREWHILLHKFYYAVGLGKAYRETGDRRYAEQWVALTDSWIAATPPGFIAADVTGRRLQNWIYAYHYFVAEGGGAPIPADFHARFLASLAEQVAFLRDNLAAARNHRSLELYAIFLAGVAFPEFADAAAWREFALPEIGRNMESDLLPDGVQCELSTDYHHLVLKSYLCTRRLAALNGIAVPAEMDRLLEKALEFSMHVHNPAGVVPSFSDGDARGFAELLLQGWELFGREDLRYVATAGRHGTAPSARSAAFPAGGYYVVRSGWGEGACAYRDEQHLVFDCGPLGAGNHGHFDCLSFELFALGRPLVVDPGRFTYDESGETNWRARFRSTAFHNTVTVDGLNQTRYERPAGPEHRDGRRSPRHKVAGPAPAHHLVERVAEEGFDLLHGRAVSHEYDAVHERRIFFVRSTYWVVVDRLTARREHLYEAHFHLGERAWGETTLSEVDGTRILVSPRLLIAQEKKDGVALLVGEGAVSHRYGEKRAAPVVRVCARAREATFVTVLLPFREPPPRLLVREMPVDEAAGAAAEAHAFAISVGAERDLLFFGGRDGREYRFDGLGFRGRYLVARTSASGAIEQAHTHPGARLVPLGPTAALPGLAAR
jgi:hypothetical protein